MSTTTQVRQRTRVRSNEGAMVKQVEKRERGQKVSSNEAVERFVGIDELSPAYVTIAGALTKNLGNYESVKITASVTLPCPPTEAAVRSARAKASAMVEEFVTLELEAIEAERA